MVTRPPFTWPASAMAVTASSVKVMLTPDELYPEAEGNEV